MFFRIWLEGYGSWDKVRNHVLMHGFSFEPGETPKDTFARMKGSAIHAWLNQREYTDKSGALVQSNDPEQFTPVEE